MVYDPLVLDEKDKEKYDKLNEKEKKGLKVKIASFGTEVRLDIFMIAELVDILPQNKPFCTLKLMG